MVLRKVTCANCGTAVEKEIKKFEIYCEKCGSYIDCDFRILRTIPIEKWNIYNDYASKFNEQIESAKSSNDTETYKNIKKKLCLKMIEIMPEMYSDQIKNEEYREKYLEWYAQNDTLIAFNKEIINAYKELADVVVGLKYETTYLNNPPMGAEDIITKISSESFRPVMDKYLETSKVHMRIANEKGIMDLHPGDMPFTGISKSNASAMVQGWAKMLKAEDLSLIMKEYGLYADYIFTDENHDLQCSGCSSTIEAVEGAEEASCKVCGKVVTIGSHEFNCSSCGAPLALGKGDKSIACPFCATLISDTGF